MDTRHRRHEIKERSSSILSSPVSTPSPEFSFTTIPLHSNSSNLIRDYSKTKTPSVAIDLPPAAADDIFFHGHLLPLHLLSHLPISPRSSTNSLENFNFPEKGSFDDPKPVKPTSKSHTNESKAKNKSKSFTLFSFRKQQTWEKEKGNQKKNKKMRFEFDVSHVLKRYMRMVRQLLFIRGKREELHHIHRQQSYSFTGNLNLEKKRTWFRGRKREYYSAPASMRTSPTNSDHLAATSGFASSTSDSTMEELQAAIQSAIAHCKNSIKGEDRLKC